MQTLTLYELTGMIRDAIEADFDDTYWITAELSEVTYKGHCYLEFIEKGVMGNEPIAKVRGLIWASVWSRIKPRFEEATGQSLRSGMQVMVRVQVTFHSKYGLSLNVLDIDPNYTLGDQARRRREIIQRLKEEGVFEMNKELPLPTFLKRVAVISSDKAAGYQDFCNQLEHNPYGLVFKVGLFPSVMQGEGVEAGVIRALEAVLNEEENWDVVVIIRGGGSSSDLSGFDSYELANNIAQYPKPIITGIGHERDTTVIDEVAHTRVKTPTAAAEFLITHQYAQLCRIQDMEATILDYCDQRMIDERHRLDRLTDRLPSLFQIRKQRELHRLDEQLTAFIGAFRQMKVRHNGKLQLIDERLTHTAQTMIARSKHQLDIAASKIEASSPKRLLRLGYSITRKNGKAVTNPSDLHPGDTLTTELADGQVISTIDRIESSEETINPSNQALMA